MTPPPSHPSREMQELLKRVKRRHSWLIKWLNAYWYIEETERYRKKSTAIKSDLDELDSFLRFHVDLSKLFSQVESLEQERNDYREALECTNTILKRSLVKLRIMHRQTQGEYGGGEPLDVLTGDIEAALEVQSKYPQER